MVACQPYVGLWRVLHTQSYGGVSSSLLVSLMESCKGVYIARLMVVFLQSCGEVLRRLHSQLYGGRKEVSI
jgi:hypothetical protein